METIHINSGDDNRRPKIATEIAGYLDPVIVIDRVGMAVRDVEIAIVDLAEAGSKFEPSTWQELNRSVSDLLAHASQSVDAGDLRRARADLKVCAIGILSKLSSVITAEMKGGAL